MGLISPTPPAPGQPRSTQETNVRTSLAALVSLLTGSADEPNLTVTMLQKLGLNDSSRSQVGRGKSIIATSESRSNVAYGTLATPDRVQGIVLPTDGLIFVVYHAVWKNSVAAAGHAAIFLGSNQLLNPPTGAGGGGDVIQQATGPINTNVDLVLATSPFGLESAGGGITGSYTGPASTGVAAVSQTASGPNGICTIFAAAGTYDVSVQFQASSGSVTAKNRKLWVWAVGF